MEKFKSIISTIEFYNSRSHLIRIFKKLSYFHRQLLIAFLKRSRKTRVLYKSIITGDVMKIVLPDNISSALYLVGFFESEETKAFLQIMKPGDTFIDIGAHIGYYSLLAKAIGGDKSRIVAIEPTPSTFAILQDNLKNKENTILLNIGLYSSPGNIEFNDFGIQYMCLNSIKEARLDQRIVGKKMVIPVKSLDSLVEELKIIPSVIKIDAESAELDIIEGGTHTLSSYNIKLFLEVGDFENTGLNNSVKIIESLEKLGYKSYEFKENNFLIHNKRKDKYPSMSLYFFKETI